MAKLKTKSEPAQLESTKRHWLDFTKIAAGIVAIGLVLVGAGWVALSSQGKSDNSRVAQVANVPVTSPEVVNSDTPVLTTITINNTSQPQPTDPSSLLATAPPTLTALTAPLTPAQTAENSTPTTPAATTATTTAPINVALEQTLF